MAIAALPLRTLDAAGDDPHRPCYHFLPHANWINDPNGLIEWQGEVHLFYQHNPFAPRHANIHWGHAASRDLLHWQDLPIALTPNAADGDGGGCWSGCAVDDDGTPTLLYTGVAPQVVLKATSSDGLLTWQKFAGNPVIAGPPADITAQNGGDFRDPYVWREGDGWRMVIGTRNEQGGVVLHYQSQNLDEWECTGPFLEGDHTASERPWGGAMWECPNLLRHSAGDLLILSPQSATYQLLEPVWHAGRAGERRFESLQQGVLVYGHTFYAPQVLRAANGRLIMWGWLKEARSQAASDAAGWNGAMSVPIEITFAADGAPLLQPVAELATLRRAHHALRDLNLDQTPALLKGVTGAALDLELELELEPGAEVGLLLRCTPDFSEHVTLWVGEGEMHVERTHAGVEEPALRLPVVAPLAPLAAGARRRLRVLLDQSTLEVFADDGSRVLATRIYPRRTDSLGVALCARNAPARAAALDVWEMASVWAEG